MATVIIAGAGIGGLTAALALARHGFRVAVLDQAQSLEEAGAGIQLSPNASRILIDLGLGERLRRHAVAPEELRVMNAPTARMLARGPLGAAAELRYGAPYWVIHRGDLQAALLDAVRADPLIALQLDARVEDFAVHGNGVTVAAPVRRPRTGATRHRPDRRRRSVVRAAPAARPSRPAEICAAHGLARARAGRCGGARSAGCRRSIFGSAAMPISCTIRFAAAA